MPCKRFCPPENEEGKEVYLSGAAVCIQEPAIRQAVVGETGIHVEPGVVMFKLLVERAMFIHIVARGTPEERPSHRLWPIMHR